MNRLCNDLVRHLLIGLDRKSLYVMSLLCNKVANVLRNKYFLKQLIILHRRRAVIYEHNSLHKWLICYDPLRDTFLVWIIDNNTVTAYRRYGDLILKPERILQYDSDHTLKARKVRKKCMRISNFDPIARRFNEDIRYIQEVLKGKRKDLPTSQVGGKCYVVL